MTELLHDIDAPSDAELISRVRGGDVAAYGELFSRHVDAARRLARQLVRGPDADDLVSDAFAKVLGVLQGGGGPDVAFRAYLLTAVRRLHVDKIRAGSKLQTSDDMEVFDAGVPFQDTAVAAFESGAAAKAFASLPERWQLVLWHLEVEGQKPADIAPLLGMSANSVSALAYRAREGLRQAFLTMHLNDTSDTSCRWVNEHLGAYVRKGLAKREATKVQTHLDECRRCTAMYLELTEVNSNLRGIIAPLLLGAAAAGYLSSTGAAGGGFGLVAFLGRARDAVTANAGAATAGAVAAGVAAVATAGIMLLPSSTPEDTVTGADGPIGQATTPGVPGGQDSPSGDRDGREGSADDGEVAVDEEPADGGTAVSEEPALEATPESVPINDAGTESTGDGGTGSQEGSSGSDTGGDTDPNQPPAEEPPAEQPPSEEPPGEEPPAPPGEEPPAPPGEEPPGEKPPGEEPPPPPPPGEVPATYKIVLGPASVTNGEVSLDLEGDPLPPEVFLSLQSQPVSVTFSGEGTCAVETDLVSATCDLAPASMFAPLARITAAVTGQSTRITMGLSEPSADAVATLAVYDKRGGTLLGQTSFAVPAPVDELEPDVGITVMQTAIEPTNVHDYAVAATLAKTDYTGGVAFILSGDPRARFADVVPAECSRESDTRIECAGLGAGSITLPLYVQDNRESDTKVTLGVEPLTGPDTDARNDSVPLVLKRFVPEPVNAAVEVTKKQEQGNSGKATLSVGVTSTPSIPVTLTGQFDPAYLDPNVAPEGCTIVAGSGLECLLAGGATTFTIAVDVGRVQNNTRYEYFRFSVSVPEAFEDTDPSDDADIEPVERFGSNLVDNGDAGGSSEDPNTSDGLQPSDTSSPVVETIADAAETFTRVARTVTLTEQRSVKERTSSTTSRVTKPARTVTTAERELNRKPSGSNATARASDADRREAVRDDRESRAEPSDKKPSAGAERSQKKSTDTTSPVADTISDQSTTSVVDTVVKGVKNIL